MTTRSRTPVTSPARGTALIVFSSCCFGTSGVLAKASIDAGLSPEQVASARICLAAVILLVGTALFRPKALRVRRRELPTLVAYGLVGVAAVQLLYFVAVARLPIGVAMLLEYMSPVLVTLWVRFVRGTRLHRAIWVGVGLAVAGLVLVAQVWDGLSLDTVGILAGLATAACSATYFLLGERSVAASDPVGITTWGLVIGAAAVTAVAPVWSLPGTVVTADTAFGPWRPPVWLLVLAVAFVATAVAYLVGMASLRHLPSSVVSVLSLIEPVTATALAWALLGQALSVIQVIGGVVLLSGALVVQLTSRRSVNAEPVVAPEYVTPESLSARSSGDGGRSPRPSGPPPAALPARSDGCR
ncbi:MAG TPA: EamA family transporter [Pseudonocardiaceae bacterium]|nr:EamA family transporter [Pseudonocardiaceae bacterium]